MWKFSISVFDDFKLHDLVLAQSRRPWHAIKPVVDLASGVGFPCPVRAFPNKDDDASYLTRDQITCMRLAG